MIANISEILLYCFAVTLNIKKIESVGNQIVPIRFFTQTSSEHYIRTLNNLMTFNKHPIDIKSAEQKILSTRNWGTIKNYQLKLRYRYKLEKKAQDIKCSYCVIAKSNILYLKTLMEKLQSGEPFVNNEETVKNLKMEAEIMLHLLLLSDLETGKWLWSYYLKITAISQYEVNKPFIRENPFDDDLLHTSVTSFIDNCISEKYLPKTATECDLVLKKPNVYDNIFRHLRDSRIFSDILTGRVVLVTIEFFYLKSFWDDENEILSRRIAEVNVDWSHAKQRHQVEVAITREFVENRTWIYRPYDRLDHQDLLVKIIDARFYCYFSVVLYIYEKQLSIRALDEQTLKPIKDLIFSAVLDAMTLTAFKDDFLVVIISEFRFAKLTDINDIQDILARVRIKAHELLNDLNGAHTNGIDWISFNVSENELSSSDLILRVIKNFKDYFNELRLFCLPFECRVLLHFMDVVKLSPAQYNK